MRKTGGDWSRRAFCGGLVGAASLPLGGCGKTMPEVHFRLTVTLDTPQGRRSGSGVIAYRSFYHGRSFAEASLTSALIEGDAVPVRLTGGSYVFALLKWPKYDAEGPMLFKSFADLLPLAEKVVADDNVKREMTVRTEALSRLRAVRAVAPGYYPVLACFDDIKDPWSCHGGLGQPGDLILPGVRLVAMTLQITDAPITRQVKQILPWLGEANYGWLDAGGGPNPLRIPEYRNIASDDFIRGMAYRRDLPVRTPPSGVPAGGR